MTAFIASPSLAAADGGTATPTLATDQLSYSPGAVVDLSGAGFAAGDAVTVTLADTLNGTTIGSAEVTVETDGTFTGVDMTLPADFSSFLTATATDVTTGGTASIPISEALTPPSITPTVTTDQQDYAPGSVVTITGSGWPAGDTISVVTDDADNHSWTQTDQVTADAAGNFTDQVTLPLMFVANYSVTASDANGLTATTTFTDADVKTATVDVRKSDCLTAQTAFNTGDTVCAHSTITSVSGNAGSTGDIFVMWVNPGGGLVGSAIQHTGANGASFNDSLAVSTSGTWHVVLCTNNSFPCGTNQTLATGTFTVAGNNPPAVAANSASVSTPEGSNATNSGTWSDANAGDTVTLSASVGTVTKAGTNASGTWSWSLATTDGPAGPTTVTITANDGHTTTSTTFTYSVTNVAPTATFNAPTSVSEGSAISLSLTSPSDPSTPDTTAGFTYAFDCGSGYGSFGTGNSTTCPTSDNGSRTVKGKIQDKDGGITEYTASVTINNVAPTATLSNNGPVNEGSPATVSFSNQSDPSSADTSAGFHYAYSCSNGDLSGATYAGSGSTASTSCTYDDGPSDHTVKARIIDKDGGFTEYTTSVHVNNVAPTATFGNDGPVDEGTSFHLSLTNPSDPSTSDTTASFTYAFDCGNGSGYGSFSSSNTATCPTTDNGTRTVKGKIQDKDGGINEYTDTVHVNNVAPTATLSNNGPVNEGSPATVSFSNQSDPSSADTSAGFHYEYNCDGSAFGPVDYASASSSNSHACTFGDNGVYTVRARIIDKDNGFTSYTTDVHVANVPPTVTAPAGQSSNEGENHSFDLGSFSDPGTDNPWTVTVDWGDSSTPDSFTMGAAGTIPAHNHTYADGPNDYTVTVTVEDKDGGSDSKTFVVHVDNVAPAVTAPSDQSSNEGENHSFDLGSFSDPGTDSPWQVSVDWGDGSPTTDYQVTGSGAATDLTIGPKSHTYANGPSDYTAAVTVTDKDGGSDTKTFSVHVNNVAPTAALSAANDTSVDEGSTHTYAYTVTDPGALDTFTVDTTDCGTNGQLVGTPTTTAHGGSFKCFFPDGPATSDVKVKVTDSDGGSDTNSQDVQVVAIANVAPTVTGPSDQSSNEGDSHSFDLGSFTDPGADNPWTVTVDWGDGSTPDSFTMAAAGTIPAHSHTYDDGPNDYTVTVSVSDKDGASDSKTFSVHVNNVAPTATFGNDGPVNEGTSFHLSLTNPSDPSSADTSAGFKYAFDCGDGSGYSAFGSDASATCPTDDNGVRIVKGEIKDKDGGVTEYTDAVSVDNVAPTATLSNNGPVDEGSPASISFSDQADPSSVDTTAGFHYAYSCTNGDLLGATYANTAANTDTKSCTFDDNGVYTVKARIIDKDGGFTEYTTSVQVDNVAPTGTLSNNGPVDEGSPATISFSNQSDPSGADTTAGFHYEYSCDGSDFGAVDYATASSSDTHQCTFDDGPSDHTVKARIIDKDNGFTVYTTSVHVDNVAPTATFGNDGPVNEGTSFHLSLTNPSDPSTADTTAGFTYAFDCGDGSGYGAFSSSSTATCPTNDNSIRSVKGKIEDKDGGVTEYTDSVTVKNVPPSVTLSGTTSANEGDTKHYTYSWSDPGTADTFPSHSVDCGIHGTPSNQAFDATSKTGSFDCTWSDDSGSGTADVTASVTDDDGGTGSDTVHVAVANVAPTVTVTGPSPVDEGSTHTYNYTVSDPGTDDTYTVDSGYPKCGTGGQYVANSLVTGLHGGSFQCFFPDGPASTNVSLKVTDDNGGSDAGSEGVQIVSVANVPPAVTVPSNQSSDEGASHSFDLGSFTDPGADSPWTVTVDWGDGSSTTSFTMSAPGTIPARSHTYADGPNDYTVTVSVSDKDGASDSKTFSVHVNNVAPTATFGNDGPVNEGSSFHLSLTNPSDPSAADTTAGFKYSFDCGDGSGYSSFGSSSTATCPTNDNGTRSIKGRIQDKDGGITVFTGSVTVNNVAPTATFGNDGPVNEGSSFHLTLTSPSDPSSVDTTAGFQYAFDCGTGSGYGAYSSSNTATCPTSDNGVRNVKGKIKDKDGGYTEYTATVNVSNVAPSVTITSPSFGALYAKSGTTNPTVSVTASFTDPGTADTHTCSIAWDDGTTTAGTVTESNGSGTCTASHTYTAADVYTFTVTVTDDDGAPGSAVGEVVVYDASAGFVTGGGWIDVQAGSYLPNTSLAGRANFGFTSQYKKGATVPTGNTEFQFQVANLNFHSENFSWLVVSGYKAQFKGTGTINGAGNYDFVLTAYDGDIGGNGQSGYDRFRIVITDHASGNVVFDNRVGSSMDMDAANPQNIAGGSIVIHKA